MEEVLMNFLHRNLEKMEASVKTCPAKIRQRCVDADRGH
jgi:hypothetical protein